MKSSNVVMYLFLFLSIHSCSDSTETLAQAHVLMDILASLGEWVEWYVFS